MSSASEKSNSSVKPVIRRRYRRSPFCEISAVEARRQVFHDLKLHRASSSSSSPPPLAMTSSISSTSSPVIFLVPQFSSLVESIPLPEPVWSTTAPSVLAHAPSSAAGTAMEALEIEWGENQASSYSWWLAFLKTLDGNNAEKSKYPLPLGSSNWLFGQQNPNSSKLLDQEIPLADANDQSPSPDEWLMFPTTEDEGAVEIP